MKAFLMMVVVAAGVGATGANDAKADPFHHGSGFYGGPVVAPVYGGPVYGGPVYGGPVYRPRPAYVYDDCYHSHGYGGPRYGYGGGYGRGYGGGYGRGFGYPRSGVSVQTNGFGFSYWK